MGLVTFSLTLPLGVSATPTSTDSEGDAAVMAVSSSIPTDEIFKVVEQAPLFPGGDSELMRWLAQNLNYPIRAQEKGISGRVIVGFVIEKDGSISNVQVVKGVDKDLDAEAVRVVKKMPNWIPGKNNGAPVRSFFNLPVKFDLYDPAPAE